MELQSILGILSIFILNECHHTKTDDTEQFRSSMTKKFANRIPTKCCRECSKCCKTEEPRLIRNRCHRVEEPIINFMNKMRELNMNPKMEDIRMNPEIYIQGMNPELADPRMNPEISIQGMNPELAVPRMNPEISIQGINPELADPRMNLEISIQGMNPELADPRMNPEIQEPNMMDSCRTCGLFDTKPLRPFVKPLITYGDLVDLPSKYPWLVAIADPTEGPIKAVNIRCTGAIINAYFILTATHCLVKNLLKHQVLKPQTHSVVYFQPRELQIAFLSLTYYVKHGPPIQKIIPNPRFKPSSWECDIGLIKLREGIICNEFASPICLPPPNFIIPRGAVLTISGFGSTDGSKDSIGTLREAKVTEVTDNCPFPPHMERDFYCLKALKEGQVACYGDSGGPLFYAHENTFYVIGVASFGRNCKLNLPFLYTSVPQHLEWIYQQMNQ